MDKYFRLPIRTLGHKRIYYNQIIINDYLKSLMGLFDKFNTLRFANLMMETTPKIELTKTIDDAYEYIKNNDEIGKESIRELYSILSSKDLEEAEKESMGEYYRKNLEFISGSSMFLIKKIGPNPEELDKYMDNFIEYIQNEKMDDFIKSQIMGLYLVYIHPYPNLNGRMSRMLSSWHLIKEHKYSCMIFNRIPSYERGKYVKNIKSIYNHGNITPFLMFVLKEVKNGLEKMQVIEKINDYNKIVDTETFRLLEYLLTLDSPSLELLYKVNFMHNRYMSKVDILEKLSKYLEDKIIILEDNTYHINEKIITR